MNSEKRAAPPPTGQCTIAITQRKEGHTYVTVARGKRITYNGSIPGQAPTIEVDPLPQPMRTKSSRA